MDNTSLAILSRCLKNPAISYHVQVEIESLPKVNKDALLRRIMQLPELSAAEIATGTNGNGHNPFINGRTIMTTDWPEPVWIVKGMIPAGLTWLAGAPKMGKSWFTSQLGLSVACGGYFLGEKVEQGRVCSLSLEDNEQRLKARMQKQGWTVEAQENVDYMLKRRFTEEIGDFRSGGADKLAVYIEKMGFRLVIIDTLSRAMGGGGDQNDVVEMTAWIDPIQMVAQEMNVGVIIIDHHKKRGGENADPIGDVLGSTAKGAVADTVIGLYRERGKPGARLAITGRDVEERTLDIYADWTTGSWQIDSTGIGHLDPFYIRILDALAEIEPASLTKIVVHVGFDKNDDRDVMKVKRALLDLERTGKTKLAKTDTSRYPLWSTVASE